MPTLFHVRPRRQTEDGPLYDVIVGPDRDPGLIVASHPIASVAQDLALILNHLAVLYASDPTDRVARELTWDLLYRIEVLSPSDRKQR